MPKSKIRLILMRLAWKFTQLRYTVLHSSLRHVFIIVERVENLNNETICQIRCWSIGKSGSSIPAFKSHEPSATRTLLRNVGVLEVNGMYK